MLFRSGDVTGTIFAQHSAGCVACHMHESNHSFMPQEAACLACHSSVPETAMDAIYTDLVEIAHALEALHAVHIDSDWEDGDALYGMVHPVLASLPRAEFQAAWNFLFMMEDRSLSAHNPTFVKAMIADCQDKLGL
mgnify:CR=1 FL=1